MRWPVRVDCQSYTHVSYNSRARRVVESEEEKLSHAYANSKCICRADVAHVATGTACTGDSPADVDIGSSGGSATARRYIVTSLVWHCRRY